MPWQTHLPSLVKAFVEAGNTDFATVVIPDQDHFFLEYQGQRLKKHKPGEMAVAEELLMVLDAELIRRGFARRDTN